MSWYVTISSSLIGKLKSLRKHWPYLTYGLVIAHKSLLSIGGENNGSHLSLLEAFRASIIYFYILFRHLWCKSWIPTGSIFVHFSSERQHGVWRRPPGRLRRVHDRIQLRGLPDLEEQREGRGRKGRVAVVGRPTRQRRCCRRRHRQQDLPGVQEFPAAAEEEQLCQELCLPRREVEETATRKLIKNWESEFFSQKINQSQNLWLKLKCCLNCFGLAHFKISNLTFHQTL